MPTKDYKRSALDEVGDRLAPPGSKPWALWMVGQARLHVQDLERDATGLQDLIRKLEKHGAWNALGFVSFGMLCHVELGLSEDEVEAIRQAKRGMTLRTVMDRAKTVKAAPAHGEIGNGRRVDDIKSTQGGTSADYLTARIARDRPDILERMKAGEFSSVRKAAIEAGIVKPATPLDTLRRAWGKASESERMAFMKWMTEN